MDPVERDLRKKLRGLRTIETRTRLKLDRPGSADRTKEYRAKLTATKRAITEVEKQLRSRNRQKAARPIIVKQAAQGRTIAVVGDIYRFLATGDDTNGKYAMWEAIVPPGGGPPPHVPSREEEGFYILDGEITLHVGDERIVVKAGMFANMPVETPHSFKNESSKPAKMLISVAPAGLEQMFFEVGVPLAEGTTIAQPPMKDEIDKMLAVAPRYGIQIKLPEH
jgi:mannose-6-phosphate isomerase-like protein (cupin superfamily)